MSGPVTNVSAAGGPAAEQEYALLPADFERIRRLIYQRAGISLHAGKQAMVYSRLSRRLRETGSSSFGSISYFDKRIEIGWSWLAKQYQGTGINFHAKFSLLSYAFDVLDWERVEIKTDNLNERAKQGLRKIGAKEEGVLRSHMQMPLNRRRDSVYFSILKNEWPAIKNSVFKEITSFHYSEK